MAADAIFNIPTLSLAHFFTTKYIQLTSMNGIIDSAVNFLAATTGYIAAL
jgi:hypothetical protein